MEAACDMPPKVSVFGAPYKCEALACGGPWLRDRSSGACRIDDVWPGTDELCLCDGRAEGALLFTVLVGKLPAGVVAADPLAEKAPGFARM